jgi:serine protease Do
MIPEPGRQVCRSRRGDRLRGYVFFLIGCFCFTASAQAANPRRTPVVDVVERVRPAVVNIHSERTVRGPATSELFSLAPSQSRINGMGTGVLIDSRGYIVTNHHVVEDVNVLRVRLYDGATYTASVVGRDHDADLALLKIDVGRPLPTVPLGTAQDLMVGETVIAIGNAYGYEHTVTVGVVSALKRDVTLNKEISYKSLIQTDASINPGNSGGPLLNVNGEMIGVNVAIRAGAQGISFAIPVDTMIRISAEMLNAARRKGMVHGLVCRDHLVTDEADAHVQRSSGTTASDRDASGEPPAWRRELVVERVEPNSPAESAGLHPGDVLTRLGSHELASSLDLERALLDHGPGDHVPLMVQRKGTSQRVELVLQRAEYVKPTAADLVWRKLGLRLKPISNDLVSRISPQLHGGLAVVEMQANGVAERAGMQRGDILVGLHQWETLSVDNVAFVVTHPDLAKFTPLSFYIIRGGQIRRGWIQQLD